MKRVSVAAIILIILLLSSCATPVGQFQESDFNWTKTTIDLNYQAVYRNLKDGFRTCRSGLSIDSEIYTDINTGHFDIRFDSRAAWVFGMIDLQHIDQNNCQVSIGVIRAYDDPLFGRTGKYRELFLNWANRIYECEQSKEVYRWVSTP